MEEWRPIAGYEGYYEISNLGNIRGLPRKTGKNRNVKGRLLRPYEPRNPKQYVRIDLSRENRKTTHELHRLLAFAFIPNPSGLREIDHIDRNHRNNSLENLRWVTRQENMLNRRFKSSASGMTGIYKASGDRYYVRIVRYKQKYRGTFDTLEEARAFVERISAQTPPASASPCTEPASDAQPSPSIVALLSDGDHHEC